MLVLNLQALVKRSPKTSMASTSNGHIKVCSKWEWVLLSRQLLSFLSVWEVFFLFSVVKEWNVQRLVGEFSGFVGVVFYVSKAHVRNIYFFQGLRHRLWRRAVLFTSSPMKINVQFHQDEINWLMSIWTYLDLRPLLK